MPVSQSSNPMLALHPPSQGTTFPLLTFVFPSSFSSNKYASGVSRRRSLLAIGASVKDFYSSLDVQRHALLPEIKSAYRKLARKYHPDVNKSPEAEERFKEIAAAYEVLSDPDKRLLYDQFGETGSVSKYNPFYGVSQAVDPFEIFNLFFGDSGGFFAGNEDDFGFRFGNFKHRDIQYNLCVTFEESVLGGHRTIEITCDDACDSCHGTGAKSSNCIDICGSCQGNGLRKRFQKTHFGTVSQVSTCTDCRGKGKLVTDNCIICGGSGKFQSRRSIQVVIPPGVSDGAAIKIKGEGHFDIERGVSGDLFIVFQLEEKKGIWREGFNLVSDISIDYTQAILGTVMKVDTVSGVQDLHIPSGIQPGETVKLKNMGIPILRSPSVRGDHIFKVNILIPKKISDKERALIIQLASLNSVKAYIRANTFSGRGIKHLSTLWGRAKHFLRKRRSQDRFASSSVATCVSLQHYQSSLSCSLTMIGVLCALFAWTISHRLRTFVSLKRKKGMQKAKGMIFD